MKQQIRNQTFETNSSSVHSVVIFDNAPDYGMETFIPIMKSNPGYILKEPEEILSYIYTVFLRHHKWFYIKELKSDYPNCIFEKPYWEDKHTGEGFYSDDVEITSFCDLYDNDFNSMYDDKNLKLLYLMRKDAIFKGEVVVKRDQDYFEYVKHHNNWDDDTTQRYLDENVKAIISDN